MGNEWDLNKEEKEGMGEAVSSEKPAASEESTTLEEPAMQDVQPAEEDTSYHWVNPEYQKRQQGIADSGQNSYETDQYRENVGKTGEWNGQEQNPGYGNEQNPPYGNNQYQAGYQGGSYHSQQKQQEAPKTGERHYGAYPFTPEQTGKKPEKKKSGGKGKRFLVTVGMAAVFGLVAGGAMFGVNALGNVVIGQEEKTEAHSQVATAEPPAQEASAVGNGSTDGYTVAQVADMCMPSVVSITNASVSTVRDFFGGVQEYPIESTGSGIIVGQNDTELLIATNNHVIAGAETLTVAFSDAAVYEAQVKGNNPDTDLAVIAVNLEDMTEDTLNAIKVVSIGDSDSLQLGEQVVAIGNALGYGQSVTSGWVSAVDREVFDENGNSTGKMIQTDAAINPGNSGGALLNMKGELIGINSAKAAATEVEGMGYAIPVATAQPILDELMNRETRYKADAKKAAYIGVVCMDVDQDAIAKYGIPKGAFVDSVEEGGPAEAAGIQKGDVITKFDGVTISGKDDLVSKLEYYEAGEEIEVIVSRAENGEYKEQTLTVKLGKRSEMTQTVPQK